MDGEVKFLERLLIKSLMEEIRGNYEEVLLLYEYDGEIKGLAERLFRFSLLLQEAFEELVNSARKIGAELYETFYSLLSEINAILYDLSAATAEQLHFVLVKAYEKLEEIDRLLEKLR